MQKIASGPELSHFLSDTGVSLTNSKTFTKKHSMEKENER